MALNPYDPEVYMGQGDAYRLLDDRVLAEKSYQQALDRDPNNASILARLGYFYRDRGERDKALQALTKALNFQWTLERHEAIQALGIPERRN